jgi:hypothetical protein
MLVALRRHADRFSLAVDREFGADGPSFAIRSVAFISEENPS